LNPQKFWAATKGMTPEEIDQLLDDLMYLAEMRDFHALERLNFIWLEEVIKANLEQATTSSLEALKVFSRAQDNSESEQQ
jgi:hypothetical protein